MVPKNTKKRGNKGWTCVSQAGGGEGHFPTKACNPLPLQMLSKTRRPSNHQLLLHCSSQMLPCRMTTNHAACGPAVHILHI